MHSRRVSFAHPVGGAEITVTAPVPKNDNLWTFFEEAQQ